jgi:hypothetical protein
LFPDISDIIVINFRERFSLLYSVIVLLRLLLCLLFFSGIIDLGINLDRVLRRFVAFDILLSYELVLILL